MTKDELIEAFVAYVGKPKPTERERAAVEAMLANVTDAQVLALTDKQVELLRAKVSLNWSSGRFNRDAEGAVAEVTDFAAKESTKEELQAANPTASKEQVAEQVDIAVALKAVAAGTPTPEQQAAVDKSRGMPIGREEAKQLLAGLNIGEKVGLSAVQQALQTTDPNDIESVRKAIMAYAGMKDLDYGKFAELLNSSIGRQIADATLAKRRGYDTGSFTRYTDAAGRSVFVSLPTEEALKGYLPGFADYNRTATSTLVDSQARFAGPNGIAQNVYALFAHTIGVLNPNKDPQKDYMPEDIFGTLTMPGEPNRDELRKNFLRSELQGNLLPERFLPDGTLNPVYERGAATADKFGNTGTASVLWSTLWENPEMLVDQTWWTTDRESRFNQMLWDAKGTYDTDAAVVSDLMRQTIYNAAKPKLDAYLSEFGPGKELAAIVAYHNPELGRKMAAGLELTDEELTAAAQVFQGVDPAKVGIITDSLDRYAKQGTSSSGSTMTIVQPDRQKISEGFRELYRQMFRSEPSDDELNALVEDVAGQYVGAQYRRQEFDTGSAMMAELRSTDLYSQLYGNKPKGMDEADYIGQFERTGQGLLGGMQASSAAVQAGMRVNNPNATAQVVGAEKASWDNSGFLERFFRSMQIANEMT